MNMDWAQRTEQLIAGTAPTGLQAAFDDEAREHVGEIMFESLSSPEDDCALCKRGVTIGAWAAFGVEDPFGPEES